MPFSEQKNEVRMHQRIYFEINNKNSAFNGVISLHVAIRALNFGKIIHLKYFHVEIKSNLGSW